MSDLSSAMSTKGDKIILPTHIPYPMSKCTSSYTAQRQATMSHLQTKTTHSNTMYQRQKSSFQFSHRGRPLVTSTVYNCKIQAVQSGLGQSSVPKTRPRNTQPYSQVVVLTQVRHQSPAAATTVEVSSDSDDSSSSMQCQHSDSQRSATLFPTTPSSPDSTPDYLEMIDSESTYSQSPTFPSRFLTQ